MPKIDALLLMNNALMSAARRGRLAGLGGAGLSVVRLRHRLDPAARPVRHRKLAIDDLDPGERIVEHPAEFAELAGVVDARQRGGEMDRMRIAEPGANMG